MVSDDDSLFSFPDDGVWIDAKVLNYNDNILVLVQLVKV